MFFSSRIQPNLPRRFGALMLSGALVASFAGLAWMSPATAAHGDGEPYGTNLSCAEIDATWQEFKLEVNPSGDTVAYENGDEFVHTVNDDLEITITNATDQSFDWSSIGNLDVVTVLVKGGEGGGGLRYDYPEGATEDTGLHALSLDGKDLVPVYHDISHVKFCFTALVAPIVVTEDTPKESDNPVEVQPAAEQAAPAAQPAAIETTVLGETLVAGDVLPRTGAAATHTLALAGGLGLALGLMMLMLARRRTAIHSS